jgi:hypothetical protein
MRTEFAQSEEVPHENTSEMIGTDISGMKHQQSAAFWHPPRKLTRIPNASTRMLLTDPNGQYGKTVRALTSPSKYTQEPRALLTYQGSTCKKKFFDKPECQVNGELG